MVAPINLSIGHTTPEASAPQPRARGHVALSCASSDGTSKLVNLRQSGSLKVLFPRNSSDTVQSVLVNTAGGVTGGDKFCVEAEVKEAARLTFTTQTAERAYRAKIGETGTLSTEIKVAKGGRLNWLPQETILFDGCCLSRSLTVDLGVEASCLLVEPLVFGRTAMGEVVSKGRFRDRIDVRRNGSPLFLDAMALDGAIHDKLSNAFTARGALALVSLLYVASDASAQLEFVRDNLPETGGANLIGEDVLFTRALAPDSFEMRQFLVPILNHLTKNALPRPWMI